eukprot:m.157776 g.157776  ORF g.157776 m.157776 type:complete len:124 (+) comp24733_c0_seq2:59-430(+)
MRFLCLLACLQILLADETLYVVDGPVARSRWDNSSDFATHVTQHFDHPVILTHTPFAMNSDAPKLWTPEFLAKTVTDGVFYNVKRLPSASSSRPPALCSPPICQWQMIQTSSLGIARTTRATI